MAALCGVAVAAGGRRALFFSVFGHALPFSLLCSFCSPPCGGGITQGGCCALAHRHSLFLIFTSHSLYHHSFSNHPFILFSHALCHLIFHYNNVISLLFLNGSSLHLSPLSWHGFGGASSSALGRGMASCL